MTKEDFLTIVAGLIILVLIIVVSILIPRGAGSVTVVTDDVDYVIGGKLKVKVENNLDEPLCFSSCYAYYFEKKESAWNNYRYKKCLEEDIINNCVEPRGIKAFELEIPKIQSGTHRMALPACIGCTINSIFSENSRFYSNEFIIK
ncbi:hypothetical protein KKA24_02900 [Patescibacteria group bacterium]|nr:hypothetical protein [Patescibacteria group bacterium]